MMNLKNWKPEVWTDLEAHAAQVEATGGEELQAAQDRVITAQETLLAMLSPAQTAQLHRTLDAISDREGVLKEAVERVALAYGFAIGAGLTSSPDAKAATVFRLAAGIATALFGSSLQPAEVASITSAIIAALERAGL